jgi:hypothetical protein|tara:strand:- start:213 stop:863 length:651 start_codon:yes stop_codon:yes gene_type:complete
MNLGSGTPNARTVMDVLLDKAGTAYFTNDEKDQFLDLAILEFITERYLMFEANQLVKDELSLCVKEVTATAAAGLIDLTASPFNTTDDKYWHLLSIEDSNKQNVKVMQWDDYTAVKNDPFNKPTYKNPVVLMLNNSTAQHLRIVGGDEAGTYTIRYLVIPTLPHADAIDDAASMCPEIPEVYHHQVIELAIRKILGNLEDPRQVVQATETKNYYQV